MSANNDNEVISMGGNTAGDLKERVREIAGLRKVEEQLKARKKEVANQIRENYKRAKSAGHDVGLMKQVVEEALLSVEERLERYENEDRADQVLQVMRKALGLDDPSGDAIGVDSAAAEAREEYADLLAGNDVIDDEPVMK